MHRQCYSQPASSSQSPQLEEANCEYIESNQLSLNRKITSKENPPKRVFIDLAEHHLLRRILRIPNITIKLAMKIIAHSPRVGMAVGVAENVNTTDPLPPAPDAPAVLTPPTQVLAFD